MAGFSGTLFDLAGRTALVTGSTRGIGRAIAWRLAQHGANVVVCGRNQEPALAVAGEINAQAAFGRAVGVAAHVGRAADLSHLADAAVDAFGAVDILVTNAAAHIHVGPSAELTEPILEKMFDVNFRSLLRLSQRLLPQMIEREFGRIINIGSIAAHFGTGIYHSYTLTKGLAMQYVRNLAVEHGERNIRANTVSPGLVRTEMAKSLLENPVELAREMSRSTIGRPGEPDEIAGAVVFLASAAGSYVNGQTIAVDGGQTIRYEPRL